VTGDTHLCFGRLAVLSPTQNTHPDKAAVWMGVLQERLELPDDSVVALLPDVTQGGYDWTAGYGSSLPECYLSGKVTFGVWFRHAIDTCPPTQYVAVIGRATPATDLG
jgi:hypothetical protein